ncbi:MAG: hypothetical protein WCP06_00490 [Verrucomicrobiota bacterium]
MKTLIRLPLFLVMLWLTCHSVFRYGFDFREGYPIWPLVGLAICFRAYVRVGDSYPVPRPVMFVGSMIDSILLFFLALLASLFLLQLRHEHAFTPVWMLHLSILICFQLLVPWIAAYTFGGSKTAVTTLVSILLILTLWKGSDSPRTFAKVQRNVLGLLSTFSKGRPI